MPLPFHDTHQLVIAALSQSKLSALTPVIERATLTTEFTNHQYSNPTLASDGTTLPATFIKADEWVAALLLCVGYGTIDAFPDYYPAPPPVDILIEPAPPFIMRPLYLPEIIYSYRRVDYNADVIKSEIVRFLI